jgi:signal transduction histidine kinase
LTDFQLFNKSIQPGENSPLEKSISLTDQVFLNHDQNSISLEFAALDFTSPYQNKYAYKLGGVDHDWIFTDASRRYVTYANMSPGSYLFRVKGTNNDGIWNETGTSIKITITPPVWQTAWFRIVSGILLLSLLIFTVRYLAIRKLKQRLQELEYQQKLDHERERISKDMHDEVGSSLTRIAILSELAKKKIEAKAGGKEQVEEIADSSRKVIDNIGEIIWAINPRNDTLENLIAYARQYVANFCELSTIHCVFDLPAQIPAVSLSAEFRRNIFLVIKEAITNIFKHAHASEVLFKIRFNHNRMTIDIADNGRGFSMGELPIFGNGLSNMKKRVEQLSGILTIISGPGEGTKIQISVNFTD